MLQLYLFLTFRLDLSFKKELMYSDSEIITGLRKRDEYVMSYVRRRYFTLVEYIVCHKGGNREDARDMFNEAVSVILIRVDDPGFELTCQFKSFLFAICENKWKLTLEKKRISGNYRFRKGDDPAPADFSENYDRKIIRELLDRSFYKLGQNCQKIMRMFWDEVPQQQIADTLGFSYAYLRKKKYICQKTLMEILVRNDRNMNILRDIIPDFSEKISRL